MTGEQYREICIHCLKYVEGKFHKCPYCGADYIGVQKEPFQLPQRTILAGRYLVGEVLGFGGFGITYKAWDMVLQSPVAIKEFYPAGHVIRVPGETQVKPYSEQGEMETAKGKLRFLEEAQNTAQFMNHPNIVNVYNFFEENGTAYFVMEYLDGISLREYVKRSGGKISTQEAIIIIKKVLSALRSIHQAGIIHRDISPDNIMVNWNGSIKLFDFGAARFSKGEDEKTLSIILKPGFAPPEQYQSKSRQGPWTDIYALGACLYRILTGTAPVESSNRVISDELNEPRSIVKEIPLYMERIILKAMAIQPELRFQSVDELENCLDRQKVIPTVKGELRRRKLRRIGYALGAVVLILCLAKVSLFFYHSQKNKAQLQDAVVEVWLSYGENEDKEEKRQLFEKAIKEYTDEYPNVSVEVSVIPQKEYEKNIYDAMEKGGMPTVFESSFLEDDSKRMDNLKEIAKLLDRSQYQCSDILKEKNIYRIPIGMDVPVVYENPEKWKKDRMYGNSKNNFLKQRSPLYIGSVSDYMEIQEEMAGNYCLAENVWEIQPVWATDFFSVDAKAGLAEKNAGRRLIYYLFGETAQDVYFTQDLHALPLNKNIINVVCSVNTELSYIEDSLENIELIEDKEKYCAEYYDILKSDSAKLDELLEKTQ